jgi:hypothetical protein
MIVDLIITIGDYCVSLISLFSLIGGFDMEYSHRDKNVLRLTNFIDNMRQAQPV